MLKTQAIELLGGSTASAAAAVGISYQAVDKWPAVLPGRIEDRVLAACVRNQIAIPPALIGKEEVPITQPNLECTPAGELSHG